MESDSLNIYGYDYISIDFRLCKGRVAGLGYLAAHIDLFESHISLIYCSHLARSLRSAIGKCHPLIPSLSGAQIKLTSNSFLVASAGVFSGGCFARCAGFLGNGRGSAEVK